MPVCSCWELAMRRSFLPIRPIGWAMTGAISSTISVICQSIQNSAPISATAVTTSRIAMLTIRVSASLTKVKSVVKRWVSEAGFSLWSWARSASIRWP